MKQFTKSEIADALIRSTATIALEMSPHCLYFLFRQLHKHRGSATEAEQKMLAIVLPQLAVALVAAVPELAQTSEIAELLGDRACEFAP